MADPGFLWVPTPEAGASIYHKFGKIIAEKCMKNERNWFEGWVSLQRPPLDTGPLDRGPQTETPPGQRPPGEGTWDQAARQEVTSYSPPCSEWLAHASENITLPQTSFAGGNKHYVKYLGLDSVKMHLHAQYKVTTWSRSELVARTERHNQNPNLAACVRG